MANPTKTHHRVTLRVLKYLKRSLGVVYSLPANLIFMCSVPTMLIEVVVLILVILSQVITSLLDILWSLGSPKSSILFHAPRLRQNTKLLPRSLKSCNGSASFLLICYNILLATLSSIAITKVLFT